jgi:hypothetical protein
MEGEALERALKDLSPRQREIAENLFRIWERKSQLFCVAFFGDMNYGSLRAKTLKELYKKACWLLNLSGRRSLYIVVSSGARMIVSLYEGASCIIDARGRVIYRA